MMCVTVVGKIPSQESGCLITVLEAILTRRQPLCMRI